MTRSLIEDAAYSRTLREWDEDKGEWVDVELTSLPFAKGDRLLASVANMTSNESNYSNTVEVNGVSFQTEIQSLIPVPVLPWTENPIRLGVCVTNKTSNCLCFERLDSLVPLPILFFLF